MSFFIAPTAVIHPGVELSEGRVVEDFCIIGSPPQGRKPGELPTRIGKGAAIRSFSVIDAGKVIGDRFQCGARQVESAGLT